ncbi:hypothetical protein [Candidatus Nitrotoga sp. AM1P]|uniref:hypothetical protein n=1 Tax=Candidatus Nitrotoga sp. AM1P TaxID=2559597 RepID=UPI0010B78701|nr:hypothetical protein [Candidatus Nitrotoga sp. AM1P]BBJ24440.1 hypothetical protein W01_23670 [Candidatus Nitrotoga sp. AM1P]
MSTLRKMNLLQCTLMSTAVLSGCSANHYSVHQVDLLDSAQSEVITVDAKRRFLVSNVVTETTEAKPATPAIPDTPATKGHPAMPAEPKKIEQFRRYCAEPSPDVFSVLGQAFSGGASFGQAADPKSMNIDLQAAFSSSEMGSTISRTQTINMLKEMMYRTCERFLNGQIGAFEYPIIAARDQRIMTSILAIEQLTGTVLPKPVVIAATGSASTGQSTNDAILSLDNANKEMAKKKTASETAQKEFAAIDNPEGSCATLMAKKEDEVTAEEDKTKLKKCKEKQGKLTIAKEEFNSAKNHYDLLASLAGKPGVSTATTNALLLSPKTEADSNIEQAKSETIKAVAFVVDKIVKRSFDQGDETSFFCYSVLNSKPEDGAVRQACLDFLTKKLKDDAAQADLKAAQSLKETLEISEQIKNLKRAQGK